MPSSREIFWTQGLNCVSCIVRHIFYHCANWEAHLNNNNNSIIIVIILFIYHLPQQLTGPGKLREYHESIKDFRDPEISGRRDSSKIQVNRRWQNVEAGTAPSVLFKNNKNHHKA